MNGWKLPFRSQQGAPQHLSAGENEPLTQPNPAFEFDQRNAW